MPLNVYVDGLQRSASFNAGVVAWKALTFEPSDGIDALFQEEEYYEAALLAIIRCYLQSTYQEHTVSNYILECTRTMINEFSRWAKSTYDLDLLAYNEQYKDYIPEKELKNYLKQTTAYGTYCGLGNVIEVWDGIMEVANSFTEAVDRAAIYMEVSNNAAKIVDYLQALYNTCSDTNMRTAIRNVYDICTDKFAFTIDSLEDWVIDVIGTMGDVFFDILYDGICACHPVGLMVKLGRAGGKALSNFLFSTDATIEQFFISQCFVKMQALILAQYSKNRDTYIRKLTVDDAYLFIVSTEMMLASYIQNCDYATEMTEKILRGGLYPKVKGLFVQDEYESICNSITSIQKGTQQLWELLWVSSQNYLDDTYTDYFAEAQPDVAPTSIMIPLVPTIVDEKLVDLPLTVDTYSFIPTAVYPDDVNLPYTLRWESSNPGVVSVSQTGRVYGVAPGTATIRVSIVEYPELYDDCLVVVSGVSDAMYADMEVTASGICGDDLTWTLYDDGKLYIAGTGDMYNYNSTNPAPWSDYNDAMYIVILGDGVTSIGNYAFRSNGSITSVILADSVQSVGSGAFFGCYKLQEVYMGRSVTSTASYAFRDCSSLHTLTIPDNWNSVGYWTFYECRKLQTIIVPATVTYVDPEVYNHYTIQVFQAEDTDTSTFMDMDGILYNKKTKTLVRFPQAKSDVTEYTVPDGTEAVGSKAFYSNNAITSVFIADSVQSIGSSVFGYCSNLQEVYTGRSVTSAGGYIFEYCSSLHTLTIPDNCSFYATRNFSNCDQLKTIIVPATVTDVSHSLCDHYAIQNFQAEDTDTSTFMDVDGVLYNKKTKTLVRFPQAKSDVTNYTVLDGTETIDDYAFCGNNVITSVIMADSVQSIGKEAFRYCSNLQEVYMGRSVTSTDLRVFYFCSSLHTLTIPDSWNCFGLNTF